MFIYRERKFCLLFFAKSLCNIFMFCHVYQFCLKILSFSFKKCILFFHMKNFFSENRNNISIFHTQRHIIFPLPKCPKHIVLKYDYYYVTMQNYVNKLYVEHWSFKKILTYNTSLLCKLKCENTIKRRCWICFFPSISTTNAH